MKGKGTLTIEIIKKINQVKIIISDTGKGIPKNQFQSIFEPGFTTKKEVGVLDYRYLRGLQRTIIKEK